MVLEEIRRRPVLQLILALGLISFLLWGYTTNWAFLQALFIKFPTKTYEFRLPETMGSVPWGRYEIGGNPVTAPNCMSERYIKNRWLTEYCRKNNIPFEQCPRCEVKVGKIDLSEVPDLIKPEVQLVKLEVWQEQFGCDYREYTMGAGVYIDGKRIGQSDSSCFSGWKKIAELKDVSHSFEVKIIALGEGWGMNAPNRYGIGDTRWIVTYYPSEFDYKGACPEGYYLVPELAKCVVECPRGFEGNETTRLCYRVIEKPIYINITENCKQLGCPVGYTCTEEGYCIKTEYVYKDCHDIGCPPGYECMPDGNCVKEVYYRETINCTVQPCPEGYVCDEESGLCLKTIVYREVKDCRTEGCPAGYKCDEETGLCLRTEVYKEVVDCTVKPCPEGYTCDEESGLCIKTEYKYYTCKEIGCPEGYTCTEEGVCVREIEAVEIGGYLIIGAIVGILVGVGIALWIWRRKSGIF